MILSLALACTKIIQFPPDLSETDDTALNPHVIDDSSIAHLCQRFTPNTHTLFINTVGLAGRAYFGIYDPVADAGEPHPLQLAATNLRDEQDSFELFLTHTTGHVTLGQTTAFSCTQTPGLSFMIWTYDRFNNPADCVRWGVGSDAPSIPTSFDDAQNPASLCRPVEVFDEII